jgi:hypothetical protein
MKRQKQDGAFTSPVRGGAMEKRLSGRKINLGGSLHLSLRHIQVRIRILNQGGSGEK